MARNECCGVGVLPFSERVGFSGIRELVRVRTGVSVKGASVRVIPGDVRVKGRGGRSVWGGGTGFGPDLRRRGHGVSGGTRRGNRRLSAGRRLWIRGS